MKARSQWHRRAGLPLVALLVIVLSLLGPACTEAGDDSESTAPGATEAAGDTGSTATVEGSDAEGGDSPSAADSNSPAAEVAADLRASVVQVAVGNLNQEGRTELAGQGSGVIYTSGGLIVTNDHVVRAGGEQPADEIVVTLASGETYEAELIGRDELTDLAVISIDAEDLPAAPFVQDLSEVIVGEYAVAIGNPLGFEGSVTLGVVSGIARELQAPGTPLFTDLIQTDAPISPGNSGGALADEESRVIGINVAAIPPGQSRAQSIGFAIPSDLVVEIVEQIIETGEVRYGFLGIQSQSIGPSLQQQLGLERADGVLVVGIGEDTPAAEAGLQQGDIITEFEGEAIGNQTDLYARLRDFGPGDTVSLTVFRDGETRQLEVTLSDRPSAN